MSTFASRQDRHRERSRRAMARVCGVLGHELNNIAMLVLGQSRAIESLAIDEKLGQAAARLDEIACELRRRLEELAAVSARAGGKRARVELGAYLESLAHDLAAAEPGRPLLLIGEKPESTVDIGLDDPSFRLAIEMLLDHVVPLGGSAAIDVLSGPGHDWGLGGPKEREAARISIRVKGAVLAADLVEKADAANSAILIGLEDEALALALLKATARRAQGRLLARLEGTDLVLDFIVPLYLDVASFVAAGPGRAEERPSRPCVLLVEDDYHVRQVTTSMFKKLGFEVLTANDRDEAETLMKGRTKIELIVSDYFVPKGDDGEVLRLADRLRKGTPLICVSGTDQADQLAGELPKIHFLRKPYTLADIRVAMGRAGLDVEA